ncbi:transposase, partial [Escherichia coli]|uniref:transposase n=1 Tax=Escherichia coli TaxID=562 RepID=UPI0035302535
KVRTLKQHPRKNKTAINIEYMKASIRARVEHPFRIIKRQFGFVKARYKGLLKNDGTVAKLAMRQPFVLFKGLTFQKLCLP